MNDKQESQSNEQSEIILLCYKKDKDLKIKVISKGYDPALNVRFPSELREEGALYFVEKIKKAENKGSEGNYYVAQGKITETNMRVREKNSLIPVSILEILATDDDKDVRCAVARNSETPADILEILATDDDPIVRYAVADNGNTPANILKILVTEIQRVAWAVADNGNTPASSLEILATDSVQDVRCAVV